MDARNLNIRRDWCKKNASVVKYDPEWNLDICEAVAQVGENAGFFMDNKGARINRACLLMKKYGYDCCDRVVFPCVNNSCESCVEWWESAEKCVMKAVEESKIGQYANYYRNAATFKGVKVEGSCLLHSDYPQYKDVVFPCMKNDCIKCIEWWEAEV